MALVRWNPMRELQTMHDRMNRFFDESLFSWGRPAEWWREASPIWSASVNLYEDENDIVMKVELPGVKKEDIFLEVKDNTIWLKAERKTETEEKEENYLQSEFKYGSFQRSFTLPVSVDADKIKAQYKDGILKVTLPKAESHRAKKIAIQA